MSDASKVKVHAILESQLLPTSSAPATLPDHVWLLAQELVGQHGSIKIATEKHGLHFYLPCPKCLETDGLAEVHKKHLAFNVDKFFGGNQRCVLCMKCGFFCDGAAMSFYPTLQDRGLDYKAEILEIERTTAPPEYLEMDQFGVVVPRNPGLVLPVTFLPETHPGCMYLRSRSFEPKQLWEQFNCSWCEVENPNARPGQP